MTVRPLRPPHCFSSLEAVRADIETVIHGKRTVVDLALTTVLARGHLLIQDVPGVGKTTLAQAIASGIGGQFGRVQFTADLLPGDITGVQMLDPDRREFQFRRGPIFANVVLGDEINRAPPRTQSAMLEAMEERIVTSDGARHRLPEPFIVVATQNPYDFEGTYPLPESQLDRFLMKISIGYPERGAELEIMKQSVKARSAAMQTADPERFAACFDAVDQITVSSEMESMMMDLVRLTRSDHRLVRGVSPRGSQALYRAARAYAFVQGRAFVIPDDLWVLAVPVLAHRVIPRTGGGPSGDGGRVAIEDILRECLDTD